MQDSANFDPFDTTDLLSLPPLHDNVSSAWSGFQFESSLENRLFHLPKTQEEELPLLKAGNFQLSLEEASLESLGASSTSAYDTAEDDRGDEDADHTFPNLDEYEDIWVLSDVKDAPRTTKLTSWDHFLQEEEYNEPSSRYLAEAGTATFDAVIALETTESPPKIALGSAYLEAMAELAMGRSSQYMRWDDQYSEFAPNITRLTVSGYSPELLDAVREVAASMGRQLRLLSRVRSDRLTGEHPAHTPGQLAFDATQESIVDAIHRHMQRERDGVMTLLQLQEILEGPRHLLGIIEQFSEVAKRHNDDHALLLAFFGAAEATSISHPQYQALSNLLLSAVAGPLLTHLACEIGLQTTQARLVGSDGNTESSPWNAICSTDLAKLIMETRDSLRLLRENASAKAEGLCGNKANAPDLGVHFSWKSLMTSFSAARDYEVAARPVPLAEAQVQDPQGLSLQASVEYTGNKTPHDPMAFQQLDFDGLSSSLEVVDGSIDSLVSECFSRDLRKEIDLPIPYDQVLSLSLTPIVTAQHRIMSYSALEVLYRSCNLRTHLGLLRQFQLFGNGLFAARVSTALFDSEQSSGEGARRDGHATGLRLQNRDVWPPASSELRLVLMGILAEHLPSTAASELENAISFSLRDLPAADLERCRDVDSIHALDFLRMQYKPPNTLLETVISPESLNRYDRIFRHLLRTLRLQSVAQTLLRDVSARNAIRVAPLEHRFRIELQHFVCVLADYSQNIAIGRTWIKFDALHGEMEQKFGRNDYEGTLGLGQCLEHLRQQHEDTLDAMLRALLLKEKQAKARSLVEEMFGIILGYAAVVRTRNDADGDDTAQTTRRLYEDFKTHLKRFKDALGGIGGLVEELLLRLDMRV